MSNAKQDFLAIIKDKPKVKCAYIADVDFHWEHRIEEIEKLSILKVGYSESDMAVFLDSLDYKYDSGYGGQELFGYIWFEDGTWAERGEYDGSEWWEYKSCPEIKKECL